MAKNPSKYFAFLSAVDQSGPRFHSIVVEVSVSPDTMRSEVFENVLQKLAAESGTQRDNLVTLYFSVEPGELG
jgi:hypothetical protein